MAEAVLVVASYREEGTAVATEVAGEEFTHLTRNIGAHPSQRQHQTSNTDFTILFGGFFRVEGPACRGHRVREPGLFSEYFRRR